VKSRLASDYFISAYILRKAAVVVTTSRIGIVVSLTHPNFTKSHIREFLVVVHGGNKTIPLHRFHYLVSNMETIIIGVYAPIFLGHAIVD